MKKQDIAIGGTQCRIYADDAPEYVLIQPTGIHETELLDEVAAGIRQHTDRRICFLAFSIADWDAALSPWRARQAFGDAYFGDGAADTLRTVTEDLIPTLCLPDDTKYILGGYSLAGLFSLWSAYQTDRFDAVAACSPSVWIDGWQEYAESHSPTAPHIYLSLGTKEHKTRNPLLQTVRQAVMRQSELLLRHGVHTALEWNPGNHFQDVPARMCKAFLWAIRAVG